MVLKDSEFEVMIMKCCDAGCFVSRVHASCFFLLLLCNLIQIYSPTYIGWCRCWTKVRIEGTEVVRLTAEKLQSFSNFSGHGGMLLLAFMDPLGSTSPFPSSLYPLTEHHLPPQRLGRPPRLPPWSDLGRPRMAGRRVLRLLQLARPYLPRTKGCEDGARRQFTARAYFRHLVRFGSIASAQPLSQFSRRQRVLQTAPFWSLASPWFELQLYQGPPSYQQQPSITSSVQHLPQFVHRIVSGSRRLLALDFVRGRG